MKNKKDDKPHYLPTFMSIGISIGAAIGVVTNNIPLYMLVGLALGVGIVVYIAANVLCWITVKRAITRAS